MTKDCNCNNFSEQILEKNIEWQPHHEDILIDWADKAMCYQWLHNRSRTKYSYLSNIFTIPVIIMSTLTGTANFAIERIPIQYKQYATIGIGSINILAGIITTISQFLKINELSESHRVASIAWDKFYRNIRVELVKAPSERTNVELVIKINRDEFDRLIETSPNIDNNILKLFHKTFSGTKATNYSRDKIEINTKRELFKSLSKPEILQYDAMCSTRNIVYKETINSPENNNKLLNLIKIKKEKMENEKKIDDFINKFQEEYSRLPSVDEIHNNLHEQFSDEFIERIINSKFLNRNNNLENI